MAKPSFGTDEQMATHYVSQMNGEEKGVDAPKGVTQLTANAQDANAHEHEMTLSDAIRDYKKAILWSFVVSMSIVMEAYDTLLLGSFYAYPTFRQKYGNLYKANNYQLAPKWQTGLSNGNTVGLIIGCLINGWLADRFGRKRVMMGAYIFLSAIVFMMFFAPNVQVLLGAEILIGLPEGIFTIMGPTYACEVCPVALRPYLTAYTNLCYVVGHLIAAGVLDGLVGDPSQWSYRIPFAVQWVWPVPLFILMIFCPESPWWLVRKQRLSEAKHSLKRLVHRRRHDRIDQTLDMMVHTNAFEEQNKTSGSWRDCFRGANLRRTEVSVMGWGLQAVPGMTIAGAAMTYFFEQAGINTKDAYKLTLGVYAVNFVGNILGWFVMGRAGRRTIYLVGFFIMGAIDFTIGFLGLPKSRAALYWAQAILIMVWYLVYSLTIGPCALTVSAETSAARQRAKTVALARCAFYVVTIINQIITPYMINPTAANLKGKAAFLPAGLCILAFIWSYFRLPECKDRTFEELDILFEKRVPTRKFKLYQINIDDVDEESVDKAAGFHPDHQAGGISSAIS